MLLGSPALILEFELIVLASVDGIEPVFGQGAKFECGLAIKFAPAQKHGNVRKVTNSRLR